MNLALKRLLRIEELEQKPIRTRLNLWKISKHLSNCVAQTSTRGSERNTDFKRSLFLWFNLLFANQLSAVLVR